MSDDPVLNLHRVAELIGVSYWTARRYVLDGELRAVKHGNRWFIRRSWVEDFLRQDAA